jgi:cellulose synthase/poly-beta-1,6-N-acetylglucosamine synthase-like glycosyltransferase
MHAMTNQPLVSILIAVRNEEKNLARLLSSLENLDYPKEKLQVIIADDESTDTSLDILADFAKEKNWLSVQNLAEIKSEITLPKGKMRALAIIQNQAFGEYVFFTDADIALPKSWIKGMLKGFSENTGIVIGISAVKKLDFISKMQNIEWLTALYVMYVNAGWGIPSTGVGNNMAISKKAFDAVGGFAGIKFSIVEDYAIYKAIIEAGFGFTHLFNSEVLAETLPPENYLEQRRRWMKGAFSSDSYLLYLSIGQALLLPICILLFFYLPIVALVLLLINFSVFIYTSLKINALISAKIKITDVLLFGFYISLGSLLQIIYYFSKRKIIWKQRTYIN